MDTELLVESWVEDGRTLLNQLMKDGFNTTAAFWVKLAEKESRVLYIAADVPPGKTSSHVYADFYPSLMKLPTAELMDSKVKVIATTDPIAQAAIAIRDRYPGRMATRYRGDRLGPLAIEEAYIYPGTTAGGVMTPNEVLLTVTGLMNRTGPVRPSIVTLADGTSFNGIPSGLNWLEGGSLKLTFTDVKTSQKRQLEVGEILSVL